MLSNQTFEDDLEQPINEIKCFLNLRHQIEQYCGQLTPMAANVNHSLKDYVIPSQDEPHLSIVPPAIEAKFRVETFTIANCVAEPVL